MMGSQIPETSVMTTFLSGPRNAKGPRSGDRGPRGSGNVVSVAQVSPQARATAVAGHPVRRDPSRLLSVARFIRETILSSRTVSPVPFVPDVPPVVVSVVVRLAVGALPRAPAAPVVGGE